MFSRIRNYLKTHLAELSLLDAPPLVRVEQTALDESGPVTPRKNGFPFSPDDKLSQVDRKCMHKNYEEQQEFFANPKEYNATAG